MNQPAAASMKKPPRLTLVLMACSVLAALLLVDWTGSGAKPLWMFFLPAAFGIAGAVHAVLQRRYLWAAGSALLGILIVQELAIIVTLILGP